VDRRGFVLAMAGGLLAAPRIGQAQPPGKVYRLGILSPATVPNPSVATSPNLVPMALHELGYTEGQNLVIERRFAEGQIDRLPALARELVQLRVGVVESVYVCRRVKEMVSSYVLPYGE